jgi:hypothetical protein
MYSGCRVHLEEGLLTGQGRFHLAAIRIYGSLSFSYSGFGRLLYKRFSTNRVSDFTFTTERSKRIRDRHGRHSVGLIKILSLSEATVLR